MKTNGIRGGAYWHRLALLFAAVAFLLVFSSTTSPLTPGCYGGDSAIFQLIGRLWANGRVPYADSFDHKGPLIFFIDALGELLAPNRTGIFLLQILFETAAAWGIYEIYRLRFSDARALLFSLLTLFCLVRWYGDGGNMTEEYCLPFLAWSFLGYYRWALSDETPHPPRLAALYGLSAAVCVLTRATNAIALSVLVFCAVVRLIRAREWSNLGGNALLFLAGFAAAVLPFVAYYASRGLLEKLYFGAIGFNLTYMQGKAELAALSLAAKLKLLVGHAPLIMALLGGAGLILRKRHVFCGVSAAAAAAASLAFPYLENAYYAHYQIVNLPLAAVGLVLLAEGLPGRGARSPLDKALLAAAGAVLAALLAVSVRAACRFETLPGSAGYQREVSFAERGAEILELIPKEERDAAVGYNVSASVFLKANILPCYTYVVMQDWHASYNTRLREGIRADFSSCRARWILAVDVKDAVVRETLDTRYTPYYESESGGYVLYRLT